MWKPLSAIDRRVAAVLVEKAKTTPDQYPLTVNSIVNGANQKSNRHPQMELDADDVAESLDRLRSLGAVTEVQGNGRTLKYRHMMYEWLGTEKVELSVMAELLLRGAQTEGELRGRAARMDPIADLAALRPILESLSAKGLIVSLTPEGRGHVLTHALYQPQEMEKLRREFHAEFAASTPTHSAAGHISPTNVANESRPAPHVAPTVRPPAINPTAAVAEAAEAVGREVSSLRAEVESTSPRSRRAIRYASDERKTNCSK